MRAIVLVLALFVIALTAGCSSISINHDWDKDAPFPDYKTYAWLEIVPTMAEDARAAQQSSDLFTRRIKRTVNAQLAVKGLTPDSENPDLLVMYHTGVQQKVNVTDWGYRYSYDYWGYGGRNIDAYEYNEGTLIIDLIDAKAKELVWRGSGTRTVDGNWSPEKADAVINDAVQKIFTKYPPPR